MGAVKKTLISVLIAAVTGTVVKHFAFKKKEMKFSHKALKAKRDLQKRLGVAMKETRKGIKQMMKARRKAAARMA